jgi:hypothetical protein
MLFGLADGETIVLRSEPFDAAEATSSIEEI